MAPAAVLPIEPGQRVLDLCAAPGGKSTQLAARLKGEGVLVSNDISPSRARGLLKNLEMTGAPSICVTAEAPEKLEKQWSGWFDRILVDAPCSGEGMFRKEPEMVRDWKERGPSHYSPIQRNILLQAARMLRPGGMLLYSTCTFSAEEDEGSVSWLLENDSEMRLLSLDPNVVPGSAESEILPGTLRLFPHLLRGEGHYLALLQKSGDTRNQNISQISAADELPGILCENQEVWSFLSQIPLFADAGLRLRLMETGGPKGKGRGRNRRKERLSFEETQGEVYLLPKEMPAWHSLRFLRTGLHVGSLKEGRFEPSQALAMALKKEELEAAKEELETKIACEKLAKPKVSAEFMTFWLHRFRKLDVRQKSHRKMLIDTFINAIFLYDDKMVITFNYKDGTDTITFDDLKTALADMKTGSDLDCSTAP